MRSVVSAIVVLLAVTVFALTQADATDVKHQKYLKATDPNVELRGGRHNFQPSIAPNASKGALIAAFDFPGFTIATTFRAVSNISIDLYQVVHRHHHQHDGKDAGEATVGKGKGDRWWNRFNATLFQVLNQSNVALQHRIISTEFAVPYAPNATRYALFENLDEDVEYRLELVKISEAMWNSILPEPNYIEFHGFLLENNPSEAHSIQVLDARVNRTRRVEFIGDSITCGFCNLCKLNPKADPYTVNMESFADSWAHLTCESLNADCHIEAWSGYGMARNCCGGTTIMPEIYNRTLASVPGSTWDFSKKKNGKTRTEKKEEAQLGSVVEGVSAGIEEKGENALLGSHQVAWEAPQAVVINLGTNDYARGPNITDQYEANYETMLRQIVHFYGSQVQIFMACGPMSTAYCDPLFRVMNRTQGWASTHFLDQRSLLNKHNNCCGHPDTAVDVTMAGITIDRIKSVMGW